MVKVTIIGRIRDGMPLAQGLRYVNEENVSFSSYYKQQAEFILKEISSCSLVPAPKMTIRLDSQHSFNCLIANGVCFITLCDSSYPRTLAFHYLQELRQELEKCESQQLIETITKPYGFVKFEVIYVTNVEGVIRSVRKKYIDTRTQANLKKLMANPSQDCDIIVENMSTLIQNRRQLDYYERVVMAPEAVSPIWSSPRLEKIALKWTPMGLAISVVVTIILWASLIRADYVVLGL